MCDKLAMKIMLSDEERGECIFSFVFLVAGVAFVGFLTVSGDQFHLFSQSPPWGESRHFV